LPELPEVETLRGDLDKEVGGRKVKSVEVRAARVVRRQARRLRRAKVIEVRVTARTRSTRHLDAGFLLRVRR